MSDDIKAAALTAAMQLVDFSPDDKSHTKIKKVARTAVALLIEMERAIKEKEDSFPEALAS